MHSARKPKIVTIIPARLASTRFPGKIIAPLAGKPLVLHAYERACRAELVSETVIATDSLEVLDKLESYGARVMLTDADHQTGTDRVAEAAAGSGADIVVNVQGDEPLIDPHTIDEAVRALLDDPEAVMATAKRRLTGPEAIRDPNIVKVVCDERGRALYFSRSPIPYVRDGGLADGEYWQHIGLYAYRLDFLLAFANMAQTPLEKQEKLEQLRALENGYPIAVVETAYESIGVDTPEDLERVNALFTTSKEELR